MQLEAHALGQRKAPPCSSGWHLPSSFSVEAASYTFMKKYAELLAIHRLLPPLLAPPLRAGSNLPLTPWSTHSLENTPWVLWPAFRSAPQEGLPLSLLLPHVSNTPAFSHTHALLPHWLPEFQGLVPDSAPLSEQFSVLGLCPSNHGVLRDGPTQTFKALAPAVPNAVQSYVT